MKAQFIIDHEFRIENYAKSVNKVQQLIYKSGLIDSGSLYLLSTYHYFFAFSSYYTNLKATSPLQLISFEDAVKNYSEIHTKRIDQISNFLMDEYEDMPVHIEANGHLKYLLVELSEQSELSLNNDSLGTINIFSLLK
jgi:hypothetical protein